VRLIKAYSKSGASYYAGTLAFNIWGKSCYQVNQIWFGLAPGLGCSTVVCATLGVRK
jgi:hypothetical protein